MQRRKYQKRIEQYMNGSTDDPLLEQYMNGSTDDPLLGVEIKGTYRYNHTFQKNKKNKRHMGFVNPGRHYSLKVLIRTGVEDLFGDFFFFTV